MGIELQEVYQEFLTRIAKDNKEHLKYYRKSIDHIDDNIRYNDIQYVTLISLACYYEYTDLFEKIIKLGANLNKLNCFGNPPLYYAENLIRVNGNTKPAKLLLSSGADPNIKVFNIPYVFNCNSFKLTQMLVEHGALINIEDFRLYKTRYNDRLINYFKKIIIKRGWVKIKCLVFTLSLHKRAVERVNHPDRLKLLGVFEI